MFASICFNGDREISLEVCHEVLCVAIAPLT